MMTPMAVIVLGCEQTPQQTMQYEVFERETNREKASATGFVLFG